MQKFSYVFSVLEDVSDATIPFLLQSSKEEDVQNNFHNQKKKRNRLNLFVSFSNSFRKQINVQQIIHPYSFYVSLKSRESSQFPNVVH